MAMTELNWECGGCCGSTAGDDDNIYIYLKRMFLKRILVENVLKVIERICPHEREPLTEDWKQTWKVKKMERTSRESKKGKRNCILPLILLIYLWTYYALYKLFFISHLNKKACCLVIITSSPPTSQPPITWEMGRGVGWIIKMKGLNTSHPHRHTTLYTSNLHDELKVLELSLSAIFSYE